MINLLNYFNRFKLKQFCIFTYYQNLLNTTKNSVTEKRFMLQNMASKSCIKLIELFFSHKDSVHVKTVFLGEANLVFDSNKITEKEIVQCFHTQRSRTSYILSPHLSIPKLHYHTFVKTYLVSSHFVLLIFQEKFLLLDYY